MSSDDTSGDQTELPTVDDIWGDFAREIVELCLTTFGKSPVVQTFVNEILEHTTKCRIRLGEHKLLSFTQLGKAINSKIYRKLVMIYARDKLLNKLIEWGCPESEMTTCDGFVDFSFVNSWLEENQWVLTAIDLSDKAKTLLTKELQSKHVLRSPCEQNDSLHETVATFLYTHHHDEYGEVCHFMYPDKFPTEMTLE